MIVSLENVTLNLNSSVGPCDASAIQAHYQALLTEWWGLFLLGGFVLGFLACYIAMGWIASRQLPSRE